MPLFSGNKLVNWVKAKEADDKWVMNLLQEHGVVSDNALTCEEVGNDREAMLWMAKNFERFRKPSV